MRNARCILVAKPNGMMSSGGTYQWSFLYQEILTGEALIRQQPVAATSDGVATNLVVAFLPMVRLPPDYSEESLEFQRSGSLWFKKWIVFLGPYDAKAGAWSFVDRDPWVGMLEATPANISRVKAALQEHRIE